MSTEITFAASVVSCSHVSVGQSEPPASRHKLGPKSPRFPPIERQLKNLLVALLPPKMAEMRKSGREIKVLVVQFACNAG